MSVEEAWKSARLTTDLPDTKETRAAFCLGAFYGICQTINNYDDDDALESLVDSVQAFGQVAGRDIPA